MAEPSRDFGGMPKGEVSRRLPLLRDAPVPPGWERNDVGERPLSGLFALLSNNSQLLSAMLPLTKYLVSESGLPPADRELAVCRVAVLLDSAFEWGYHSRSARGAGLSDDEIRRVIDGPGVPGWSEWQIAILSAVDELIQSGAISDSVWRTLANEYGHSQLLDLMATIAQYVGVAWMLRAANVPAEPGFEGVPASLEALRAHRPADPG